LEAELLYIDRRTPQAGGLTYPHLSQLLTGTPVDAWSRAQ